MTAPELDASASLPLSEAQQGFPAARRQLLALLRRHGPWTESALRSELRISVSTLRLLMRQLIDDGEAWVSQGHDHQARTYSVPPQPTLPAVVPSEPLTCAARDVLDRLRHRPDTARHLGRRLELGLAQVSGALDELEARRLVVRRYVGMLAIFRVSV